MIDRLLEFNDSSVPTLTLVNMLAKVFEERVAENSENEFLNQKASRFILFTLSINDGISQNDIVRATHLKGSTAKFKSIPSDDEIVTKIIDEYLESHQEEEICID